jgi:hypothetical protein
MPPFAVLVERLLVGPAFADVSLFGAGAFAASAFAAVFVAVAFATDALLAADFEAAVFFATGFAVVGFFAAAGFAAVVFFAAVGFAVARAEADLAAVLRFFATGSACAGPSLFTSGAEVVCGVDCAASLRAIAFPSVEDGSGILAQYFRISKTRVPSTQRCLGRGRPRVKLLQS